MHGYPQWCRTEWRKHLNGLPLLLYSRMKEPMPVQTGLFAQFGSKFRYSGRTFYQSRNSRIDRPAPEFDRTSSRRMTGSRSMDYGGSSFEHDTSRLHSTSLDFKAKRKGYDDDMNRSGTVSTHTLFSVFLFSFLSYFFISLIIVLIMNIMKSA